MPVPSTKVGLSSCFAGHEACMIALLEAGADVTAGG